MDQKIEVRRASDGEIEAARQLTNRSWLTTYAALIGETETRKIIATRHSGAVFQEQAADAASDFFVAVKDGGVVGHSHSYAKDGYYIDRLHVEPDLKGAGIGGMLLRHMEADLARGTRVWLEVLDGNDNAVAFYQHCGFVPQRRTDACGGVAGVPAVILEKTIN